MDIRFKCPDCGKKLKIKEEYAGKQAKCPGCGKALAIPRPVVQPQATDQPAASSQPVAPPPTTSGPRKRKQDKKSPSIGARCDECDTVIHKWGGYLFRPEPPPELLGAGFAMLSVREYLLCGKCAAQQPRSSKFAALRWWREHPNGSPFFVPDSANGATARSGEYDEGSNAAAVTIIVLLVACGVLIWWRPLGSLRLWPKIGLTVLGSALSFSFGMVAELIEKRLRKSGAIRGE